MKKVLSILSIVVLASCGGSSVDSTVDSTVVVDTVLVDSVSVVDSISVDTLVTK